MPLQSEGRQKPEASQQLGKSYVPESSLVESLPLVELLPSDRRLWLDSVFGPESPGRIKEREDAVSSKDSGRDFGDRGQAENRSSLIHDARNMVSAMDLYCDLLQEPGVLTETFRHYAAELRLVGSASRRLLEKLSIQESGQESSEFSSEESRSDLRLNSSNASPFGRFRSLESGPLASLGLPPTTGRDRQGFPLERPIASLAEEIRANLNLVSALAGPGITVGLSVAGAQHPIAMTGDDLTRVLVNLARNSTDAMPHGGHIQIALEERPGHLSLSFTDNGPGIPDAALEAIFSPGYSTHVSLDRAAAPGAWPVQHRGLGLSIVRSIVSAAKGAVWAANRTDLESRLDESRAESRAESRDDSRKDKSDFNDPAFEFPPSSSPKPTGHPQETFGVAEKESAETTSDSKFAVTGAVISLEFPIEESTRIP